MSMKTAQVAVEAKVWGETRNTFRDKTHEVWHASITAGGFSSVHYHKHKTNHFYVASGTLLVRVYPDGPQAPGRAFLLGAGASITVEPGVWHRFEAVSAVELVETYWAGLEDGYDIVRHDDGGVKKPG